MTTDACLKSLLAELCQGGVRLDREAGDRLVVHAPRDWLTHERLAALRERKPALLAWLAAPPAHEAQAALPQIQPEPTRHAEPLPLSDLQAAFVMADHEDIAFHVRPHSYLEVDWPGLEPARYETALNAALARQRHNLFVLSEQLQLQPIDVLTPVTVQVHDLRALPPQEQRHALRDLHQHFARRTLPLDRWPWFTCAISLHGQGQARLHWNNNNFFSDGYGSAKLMDDTRRLYDDPATALPPLQLSYRDCLRTLQQIEDSPLGQRARDYWLQRLPRLPGPPPLPAGPHALPPGRPRRSWLERRETLLPAAAWSAFKRHAGLHGLTPTGALFAAYAQVLARWSGSRHFLLSNMVTHRLPMHAQVSEVLGNFASLYPLEVDWRDGGPFAQRARALQQRMADDLAHVHWSGVKVLQALNQAQDTPGRAPCPFVVGSGLFMPPLPLPYAGALETPQVQLDHQFWELQDGRLWVVWDAIEACFPPGLLPDMQDAHRRLLLQLAQDGEAWQASSFDLLPERQQARRRLANNTETVRPAGRVHGGRVHGDRLQDGPLQDGGLHDVPVQDVPVQDGLPQDGLLHGGLCNAARRWPERCAVADPRRRLSYAQLHAQANRLAHALRAAGVRPGDRVPVLLDKGWEQAVAVHGVLRAGAAYVPIDPAWPAARTAALLADMRATHAVSRSALAAGLPLPAHVALCRVDGPETAQQPGTTPPCEARPDSLAYILFTSGSTGVPKGVMIDHRGALNTVADINQRFGITEQDVVFGLSALHFDLSVYDLFGALAAGATLVLPGPAHLLDPAAWLAQLQAEKVTLWNSVPALMQLLAEAAAHTAQQLPALRTVMLSGDWIPVSLPGQVQRIAPQAQVISLGGATEASIWSIYHVIDAADAQRPSIPYGRPLANQRWHVLDDEGQDAPDWVTGHLHIAGTGLALGYWNDPHKTAAAFVTHPRTGERLYRTGDLGRYLPDGCIEFAGRSDQQVKIQGFRVELGEVEQALLAHPAVESAVALAAGGDAGRQLRGFVVARPGADPQPAELQAFLRGRLPPHMVPTLLTRLAALPLTATGKLDRKALMALHDLATAAPPARTAPRSATEALLADIWAEVLEQPDIGVHDDFFALGGQSFAAVRAIARITARTGCRLPLGDLLEARTIARLAERLAQRPAWSPLVALNSENSGQPCFLVHPAGGNVLCYRALAQRLQRPVLGLQAAGLQGEQAPLGTVEDMAALYLRAVRERQPRGPYLLGGWSSGGVIAFEMARQLEAQGERVEPLLLIDSPAPLQHAPVDAQALATWFVQDLDIGFDPAAASNAPPCTDALAQAAAQGVAHALDIDLLRPVHAVFSAVIQATRAYHPNNASLAAGIGVLRAADGSVAEFAGHPAAAQADWGWSAFTRGPVRAARVGGTHHSMMKPVNADALWHAWAALWPCGGDGARDTGHGEASNA